MKNLVIAKVWLVLIVLMTTTVLPSCMLAYPAIAAIANADANQKREDQRLIAEEQNRIAEQQRQEQIRIAKEERLRKQVEYDRWFACLSKEQQVQIKLSDAATARTDATNQMRLLGHGIEAFRLLTE